MQFNKLESYGEKIKTIDENIVQKSAKLVGANLGRKTSQKIREFNQSPTLVPASEVANSKDTRAYNY
jgi:hypothetical protein